MAVNHRVIAENIKNEALRLTRPQFTAIANDIFKKVKADILAQVRNHPISLELISHTSPSAFLSGRSGTLFGFMGLYASDQPVERLLTLLEKSVKLKINRRFLNGMSMELILPNESELRSQFPLPWEGGISIWEAIETGISGLGAYLPIPGLGQSNEGIQLQNDFRKQQYRPQPYLSEIFQQAQERISNY